MSIGKGAASISKMCVLFSFWGTLLLIGYVAAEDKWYLNLKYSGKTSASGIYIFGEDDAFSVNIVSFVYSLLST